MKIKKTLPFYDLYKDGLTQSMIVSWLRCPKQCEIEYVKGYRQPEQSDALVFGNCVHYVLQEMYFKGDLILPGLIKAYINKYSESVHNDELSVEIQEQNEISFSKAEAILRAYVACYTKDFDLVWLMTEKEFDVPFEFKDFETIRLRGRIDGGFQLKENSPLWLIDHKTKSQINIDHLLTVLPVDFQVNFYLHCAWEMDLRPRGFIYNIIRNPQSKPHKNEELDAYTNRLEEKIIGDPHHYFQRIKIPVFRKEVTAWKNKMLFPILRDIRHWFETEYKWPGYYNPEALLTKYGLSPYAEAIINNDYTFLSKKTRPFEELD